MLITNTPNNELHIFNNEGEEIVSINDSGVTKSGSGLIVHADELNNAGVIWGTFGEYDSEEEANKAYLDIKQNVYHFGLTLDENTAVSDEYVNADAFKHWAENGCVFHFFAFMTSAKDEVEMGDDLYISGTPPFYMAGGFSIAHSTTKWIVEFSADIMIQSQETLGDIDQQSGTLN